ncbi:hypothetical protein [Larsenimonas rhizosphaerae]|uniref:hypothetical protein n=1 Tax=Larsenimonas rhizosphaerae TaxID=2944682 RepID=UPI002033F9D6|nr:hypothetical protein [Larsenimonas rhizosphaerae]MCM2131778.1 hypothetical protein [Larsenimonas rhizosphaerae]
MAPPENLLAEGKFILEKTGPILSMAQGDEMNFFNRIPSWLVDIFRIALLGEIYPNIRAIAVGYCDNGSVLIRYYLDREPTDFDLESIEIVATNLDALDGKEQCIDKIDVQCIHSTSLKRDLESLSGFVYSRYEFSDD